MGPTAATRLTCPAVTPTDRTTPTGRAGASRPRAAWAPANPAARTRTVNPDGAGNVNNRRGAPGPPGARGGSARGGPEKVGGATACTGPCTACTEALTGQKNGTCAAVQAGKDPKDDCAADMPKTCGHDGTCD